MLLFSDMFDMLVRYANPSGPMCMRCMMLILSGPVELFLLLCFIALGHCLQCVCFPIYVSVCVVCFMFDCVGELWVVLGVFCWLIRVWSSKEYVCCVCDPSVHLSAPSICQICVFV